MKKIHLIFSILLLRLLANGQVIPDSIRVNWSYAGVNRWQPDTTNIANVKTFGAAGDGISNDYTAIVNAINSLSGKSGIVFFPAGNYLIKSTINLPDSITLKGEGAALTTLTFDLGGTSGNCINIGKSQAGSFVKVDGGYQKGSYKLFLANTSLFTKGDYAEILEDNGAWDTHPASWAGSSVGQIVRVDSVDGNALYINHPLRIDYDSALHVRIQIVIPRVNVGLECFKITRVDSTAPSVNYMTYFNYAVNCRMAGIESDHSLGAHVWAEASSNISITGCYFHHAYVYDGAGTTGYGVGMAVHSGECKIENNIFRHLRHSMVAKQGANGNVYAYNYSIDPNRSEYPANAGADIVLHGHYAYANLFEGNIVQTALVDSTWGPSGPYNTFFRNRMELYGLIISPATPGNDRQNVVGNDIISGLYILSGSGHLVYGNRVQGVINPPGTSVLPDSTYYLTSYPSFWQNVPSWPDIGTPYSLTSETIPAKERYKSGNDLTVCGAGLPTHTSFDNYINKSIAAFPNPFNNCVTVQYYSDKKTKTEIVLYNLMGIMVIRKTVDSVIGLNTAKLDVQTVEPGIYVIFTGIDNLLPLKCIKE